MSSSTAEFEAALTAILVAVDDAARASVSESASVLEAAAKRNFSGAHPRGAPHIGGDLPNVVTGTLRRSITQEPVRRLGAGVWGTRLGPTTVYGRRVELGYHGSRGYPFFEPAVRSSARRVREIAARRVSEAIRGAR